MVGGLVWVRMDLVQREIERDQGNHKFTKHKNTSPQEAVLPLVLFILSPRGNPPSHTGVGYYTTTVARTSINLLSLVLRVCRVRL